MKKEYKKVVEKNVDIKTFKVDVSDLEKINKFSLEKLSKDEVFTFKMSAGTNEDDDRNYMPFTGKSIEDMANLYVGKAVITNHNRDSDNQFARIFDTEIREDKNRTTKLNEPFKELILKAYMMRTEKNKDLIEEIRGGIKKEVSTSTLPEKLTCNICGQDNMKRYCSHFPGEKYDGEICKMTIDGISEAYELSFVVVPAQPNAGTTKAVESISVKEEKEEKKKSEIDNFLKLEKVLKLKLIKFKFNKEMEK